MSIVILIALLAGVAYLVFFKQAQNYSVDELQKWFSSQLSTIAFNLQDDIEKDRQGEYPHAGKQSFEKHGSIVYVLLDKSYLRFELSARNALQLADIKNTQGYSKLHKKVNELNLSMQLDEKQIEGDGVETFMELDEYIGDKPRYFTVTIAGW